MRTVIASYSLDALCAWRGLPGKDETLLRQAVEALGEKLSNKNRPQAHIWRLPAYFAGPYAEADAANTLALFENLNPILDKEGTRDAYRLEVALLPMVHAMRRRGTRVDQSVAEQARDYCLQKRDQTLAKLSEQLATPIGMAEIASRNWLVKTFDAHRISYPRAKKGNPSFKGGNLGWMHKHPHWLPQLIAKDNKYNFAGSTFLEGHILGHLIGDRVYAEIHPHRSDDGGTVSTRFSYSDPPLQQMPSRDEELGPLIRRVFLPEAGELWCTVDCSQQEFRFVVHHAALRNLPGAREAAERYRNDPDTDFHEMASAITGLARKDAKGTNFAKVYGASVKKFAEMIGKPLSEAQLIYAQYDIRLPFVWQLSRDVRNEAERLGFTVPYDGARRHWNLYEAAGIYETGAGPCPHEEAMRRRRDPKHPWFAAEIRLAKTYTALNGLIQGSAARHTKLWMLACWREGIVPLLQMHDGLELSITRREQGELVAQLACEAVKLEVPMRADIKFGRSWGDATHAWDALGAAPLAFNSAQTTTSYTRIVTAPKPIVTGPIVTPPKPPVVAGFITTPKPAATGPTPLARPNGAATIRMSAAETIAKALGGHRSGNGWVAQCPLHDDRTPSLSISSGKNGKVLVHCHAGCNQRDVFIAVTRKRGLLGSVRMPANRQDIENDAGARNRKAYALRIWSVWLPSAWASLSVD
jgi:DNA polymerase I-like protein with 3'-5' exonuclease and polymerase domains